MLILICACIAHAAACMMHAAARAGAGARRARARAYVYRSEILVSPCVPRGPASRPAVSGAGSRGPGVRGPAAVCPARDRPPRMQGRLLGVLAAATIRTASAPPAESDPRLAPLAAPAVPLIANDPYFQTYSPRGRLNERATVAGMDGAPQQLSAIAYVDGRACQLIGPPQTGAAAAAQLSVVIYPTRTVYQMLCGEGSAWRTPVTVTFMSPQLPSNVTIMARPASYVVFRSPSARSVRVYVDISSEAAVSPKSTGKVVCGANRTETGLGWGYLGNAATQKKPIPCRDPSATTCWEPGNIDWGRLYLGSAGHDVAVGRAEALRRIFVSNGRLAPSNPCTSPLEGARLLVLATVLDLNKQSQPGVSRSAIVAYDEDVAIRWWDKDFPGLWRQEVPTAPGMLAVAAAEEGYVTALCTAFDHAEVERYHAVGGPKFAALLSLAYRQAYSSTKLVWNPEQRTHWLFLDEISTSGDLNTMDVIYPASTLFVYQEPELAYRLLVPTLEYATNATNVTWNLSWCPHHLGKYPVGYILPSHQEHMPIEETANMQLMLAAIAQRKGNRTDFIAPRYWQLLRRFADYLVSRAFDPTDQLCSDDFMGKSAHNANLAVKGILAISAYAQLMEFKGEVGTAAEYMAIARNYSAFWQQHARAGDGSHYKLAYNASDASWSQKYNLVWDKILQLGLIPQSVFDTEVAFYKQRFARFGLQLDHRRDLTKTDWLMWTGALGDEAYFGQVVDSVFAQLGADNTDKPLTDLYNTSTAQAAPPPLGVGFRDRAVVGAFWAKMLIAYM
eukprot:SAG22_NODE_150_length_17426_cov_8.082588_12_plen_787_part_00